MSTNRSDEGFVPLPSGEALNVDEANQTARSSVTRVVVPAGVAGVGKTTLLSEIYEKYLEGPFAEHRFAYSKTLLGFEQRAHHARVASRRLTPTTLRTPISDTRAFLHLRLAPCSGKLPPRDLLIADWPGEAFREMRDNVQTTWSHPILARADHIAFLVDGESLGHLESRQEASHEADMLIQSVLDGGIKRAAMSVVYTKWDAALAGNGSDQLDEFRSVFEDMLRRKHSGRLGELRFIRTAARPKPGTPFNRGHNLDEVLRCWLGPPRGRLLVNPTPHGVAVREFDNFRFFGQGRQQ